MRALLTLFLLLAVPAIAAEPAATPGLHAFTPPPGDIAVGFLRQIFGSIVDGGGTGDQQSLLGVMMGVFNTAVLFLAMLFVLYTTVKGTVDSAHDGVLLGKKMSEIWVPIRTVGGTALLLPLASGFSLLQVAMIWLAMQGVGVADSIWQVTTGHFARHGTLGHINVPDARPLAANILRAEVCMAAMNKQYEAEERKTRIVAEKIRIPIAGGFGGKLTEYRWRKNDSNTSAAACGSLQWSENPQQAKTGRDAASVEFVGPQSLSDAWNGPALWFVSPLLEAHAVAVGDMITNLRPVAQGIVATAQRPAAGVIEAAAGRYEATIAAAAKKAVDAAPEVAQQSFIKEAETGGFVLAGTWFSHMVKVNDAVQSAVNMVPVSKPIRIEDLEVNEALIGYRDAMTLADEFLKDRSGAPRRAYDASIDEATSIRSADDVMRLLSVPAMAALNNITTRIAGANTSAIEQLRVLGNEIVMAGVYLKGTYFTIMGLSGGRLASWSIGNVFNVTEAARTLSGTVEWISSALWALGAWLAWYLPFVPVLWWVAGIVRWLASVAEAVLAAPLMAAMHVHPGGDDFVGRAGPGYMLILAMVIQPALLLFGLVLAGAIMYPAGALVNMMFLGAVSGVTGSTGVGLIALVAWVALYVVMMTMAIHACFALVSSVPDNVMRWVGSQAGAQGVGIKEVEKSVGGLEQGSKGAGQGAVHRGSAGPRGSGADGKPGGREPNGFSNAELMPDASDRKG
ncbi:MAG: DotA/TraY family protein [Rhodocyclales bacterium]|nr:DotA/TraY family protein [Rhodocyclales bacterium]